MEESRSNNYSWVAQLYDFLAHVYSMGQITACKRSQLDVIEPGATILYAGAGGAIDAVMAAKAGARVTIVDLSQGMIDVARERLKKNGVDDRVEVICGDMLDHLRTYDIVVSNFFLNVFDVHGMRTMLHHLMQRVRPGGKLLISDFRPVQGSWPVRLFQRFYYGLAMWAFVLTAKNAIHPIYDYRPLLEESGLDVVEERDFQLFRGGPSIYRVWFGYRVA